MKLVYTDRAKDEIDLAFEWYERQRRGLGYDFIDCVEAGIKLIMSYPDLYRVFYKNFRGCVIRRFPFTIFYTIEEQTIIVHSVFANKQDPDNKP